MHLQVVLLYCHYIVFFMFRHFMGHRQGKNTTDLVQCFHLEYVVNHSQRSCFHKIGLKKFKWMLELKKIIAISMYFFNINL